VLEVQSGRQAVCRTLQRELSSFSTTFPQLHSPNDAGDFRDEQVLP
jgi:hypothetical protein